MFIVFSLVYFEIIEIVMECFERLNTITTQLLCAGLSKEYLYSLNLRAKHVTSAYFLLFGFLEISFRISSRGLDIVQPSFGKGILRIKFYF